MPRSTDREAAEKVEKVRRILKRNVRPLTARQVSAWTGIPLQTVRKILSRNDDIFKEVEGLKGWHGCKIWTIKRNE